MAREHFDIRPYPEGGGARVRRYAMTEAHTLAHDETREIGERQYLTICDFLRDVARGMEHGKITPEPPAYAINLTTAGGTVTYHATPSGTHNYVLSVWAINAFVALCELVAKGKKDDDFKAITQILDDLKNGYIESNAEDTDRAFLDGVAAVIAELAGLEDAPAGGEIVHQAWYQAMTLQGRAVPPDRRAYHTLHARDRDLDRHIARVVLQQAALTANENVRIARSVVDDSTASTGNDAQDFIMLRGKYARENVPATPTRMAEKIYREIVAMDIDAGESANLTPHEWQQLVKDARNDRDAAEIRHAKSEELRRADNVAWAVDKEAIDQQAREIAKLKETISEHAEMRRTLDAEIVKLNKEIDNRANTIGALDTELGEANRKIEIYERDSPPIRMTEGFPIDRFDIVGWQFANEMIHAPRIASLFTGVAAIGLELATVRMMANNPKTRDTDPCGLPKRLATIAGYALQLYRDDRRNDHGDPIVAQDDQPS